MKSPNRNYKQFVYDIVEKYEDLVPFNFEDFSLGLPHREFLLVVYSILKQRPNNKELINILWNYIRSTDKEIPNNIYQFAKEKYIEVSVFNTRGHEQKIESSSLSALPAFKKSYNGYIYAVNIDTMKITPITSMAQAKELGFTKQGIDACLARRAYTHRNHVFIRDKEKSHEPLADAIRQGHRRIS